MISKFKLQSVRTVSHRQQPHCTMIKPSEASPDHLLSGTLNSINLLNNTGRILIGLFQQEYLPRPSHSFQIFYTQQGKIFSAFLKLLSSLKLNPKDVQQIYKLGKLKTKCKKKKKSKNKTQLTKLTIWLKVNNSNKCKEKPHILLKTRKQ